MTTGKTITLTIGTFVDKMMSLLFNILSRFVIAFLSRSKHHLISQHAAMTVWLQSLSAVISKCRKRESVTASTFSLSICHEVMGSDARILLFWMLSFKPSFHSPLCVVIDCFKRQNMFIGNSFSYPPQRWVQIRSLLRFALKYLALVLRNGIASYPDGTFISKDLGALAVEFWEISSCTTILRDFQK